MSVISIDELIICFGGSFLTFIFIDRGYGFDTEATLAIFIKSFHLLHSFHPSFLLVLLFLSFWSGMWLIEIGMVVNILYGKFRLTIVLFYNHEK
jgi:hypothetical protein